MWASPNPTDSWIMGPFLSPYQQGTGISNIEGRGRVGGQGIPGALWRPLTPETRLPKRHVPAESRRTGSSITMRDCCRSRGRDEWISRLGGKGPVDAGWLRPNPADALRGSER